MTGFVKARKRIEDDFWDRVLKNEIILGWDFLNCLRHSHLGSGESVLLAFRTMIYEVTG
jgi:hypothetical protein